MTNHSHSENGFGQKSFWIYITGFSISIVLTIMAFALVELRILKDQFIYFSIAILAIIQLLVHSTCFLRLNHDPEGRWNLLPFLFTIFIVFILAGGTLWIMYNLSYNMIEDY